MPHRRLSWPHTDCFQVHQYPVTKLETFCQSWWHQVCPERSWVRAQYFVFTPVHWLEHKRGGQRDGHLPVFFALDKWMMFMSRGQGPERLHHWLLISSQKKSREFVIFCYLSETTAINSGGITNEIHNEVQHYWHKYIYGGEKRFPDLLCHHCTWRNL